AATSPPKAGMVHSRRPPPYSPLPGEVDGHDLMPVGERGYLVPPVRAIAGPAVDEDESRAPGAVRLEVDRDPVRPDGDILHRKEDRRTGSDDGGYRRARTLPTWPR